MTVDNVASPFGNVSQTLAWAARAACAAAPGPAAGERPSVRPVKVLLVEDNPLDRAALERHVREERLPYVLSVVDSIAEARRTLATESFQAIVTDFRLGDGTALNLLELKPGAPVVVTTGAGSEEVAVQAMKAGAQDYLIKDIQRRYLKVLPVALERAIRQRAAERRSSLWSQRETEEADVAVGAGLAEVQHLMGLAAASDSPVFITGETGTGKNLVARAIHHRGPLHSAPLLTINCAALPEHLVEGELFGYEKGAFTGAVSAKKGLFELAEGGTLVLDEMGEMPLHLQAKLLGVLDDKRVRRLGSETARVVNTRVLAATSVDVDTLLGTRLRQDLYYRLSVIRIRLPPLRERREDIPVLCQHLLKKLSQGLPVELSRAEVERLQDYAWPGNVRELRNVLERALILHRGGALRPSELLGRKTVAAPEGPADAVRTLEAVEREHILKMLGRFGGNITQTARALGVSVSTLKRKKRGYGMP